MVGIVVTISPSLSLYKMVVLPAASKPTIRIRISFLAKSRLKSLVNVNPIFLSGDGPLHTNAHTKKKLLRTSDPLLEIKFVNLYNHNHKKSTQDQSENDRRYPKFKAFCQSDMMCNSDILSSIARSDFPDLLISNINDLS